MQDDSESEMLRAMLDDDFQRILSEDEVISELEQTKYDPKINYFELMMCLSKVFRIDGVSVACLTPAVWAFLYAIGSPYATDGEITELDTDIVMHLLHGGIKAADSDLVERASGFCAAHGIDPKSAEADLKTLIYLSFRPLEMLAPISHQADEKPRYDLDWLTHIVSVVSPLTGRTSDAVIYDTSICECMYYCVQQARQYDYKHEIRRRDSLETQAEIYERTMELGRQYWERKRAVDDSPK